MLPMRTFMLFALAGLAFGLPARAQEAPPVLEAALIEQVRALALGAPAPAKGSDAATTTASPKPHRVEVVVGQLDPRLRLAPCQSIEPYVPPNARLWGKSRIGLRCRQGAVAWNVYLPITVKVWGPALVLAGGGASGSSISAADIGEAEVDLAEEPTPVITDRKELVGRTLAQALKPGQALRQGHIKARQWFVAGETVKVIVAGEGYRLESEGQALSNGIEGQPARVRTESGRILTGLPAGERRVELSL